MLGARRAGQAPTPGGHGGASRRYFEARMWGHMSTTDLPGSSLLAGRYRLVGLDAGHWLPERASADVVAAVHHQIIHTSGSR